MTAFCDTAPYSLVEDDGRFRGSVLSPSSGRRPVLSQKAVIYILAAMRARNIIVLTVTIDNAQINIPRQTLKNKGNFLIMQLTFKTHYRMFS
jgi:hypothetical protein